MVRNGHSLGLAAQKRVRSADEFATARSGYGPLFLSFAFAATSASGAIFIGWSGLAYEAGLSMIWIIVAFPAGMYIGMLICVRSVRSVGEAYRSRSIPEYLGRRYDSELIRILVSVFSLLLLFYIAAQLISGIVIFEMMLGLQPFWALAITAVVLLIYVVLGGTHADILTDGVQGFLMLAVAALVGSMFVTGYGIDGGLAGLVDELARQDPDFVAWLNPKSSLFGSWWSILALPIFFIPIGLLPHLGNKFWALRDGKQQYLFIHLSCVFALILGFLGLGGLLARAMGMEIENGNMSLPSLFVELFPPWISALLGVGILSAIMSTADGLVISSSQIIANDIYRCSIVPRYKNRLPEETAERNVLLISRWSSVVILMLCALLGWFLMDRNIALVVVMGIGGMMSGFAGPLVLGAIWRGVTRNGALSGLVAGVVVFGMTHLGLVDPAWFPADGMIREIAIWLRDQAPNPYSCATLGEIASLGVTFLVSKRTRPLPAEYLATVFSES